MHPRVSVSHASEDKDRFVIGFATELRERGVDAWVDRWEMGPGDSLIDKIFEEGIKSAQAVIVVISKFSVKKKWVREELNAAMVKKINPGSMLIPVIIDESEVPECLQSTLWEKIADLANYTDSLDRIVGSIFGYREKPPLGKPPPYAEAIIDVPYGLNRIDAIVLEIACQLGLEQNNLSLNSADVRKKAREMGITDEDFQDALEMLDRHYLIKATHVVGGGIPHFLITPSGFDKFARQVHGYEAIVSLVYAEIINNQLKDSFSLAARLERPQVLVNHIFDICENRGLIKQVKTIAGCRHVRYVSPELKRLVRNN